jgi:excinuclease ABC subunit B
MAEDLSDYYEKLGIKVRYLHSDIKTLQRVELIRDLRNGEYTVLIGINLLREGLDIPEVSLVAVLDADKEGFLRSERSLTQTCGRAARNAEGLVILYADTITGSMQRTIEETGRRRAIQEKYNQERGIIPTTIRSRVKDSLNQHLAASGYAPWDDSAPEKGLLAAEPLPAYGSIKELEKEIKKLEKEMQTAAQELAFEQAAALRDRIKALRKLEIEIG